MILDYWNIYVVPLMHKISIGKI